MLRLYIILTLLLSCFSSLLIYFSLSFSNLSLCLVFLSSPHRIVYFLVRSKMLWISCNLLNKWASFSFWHEINISIFAGQYLWRSSHKPVVMQHPPFAKQCSNISCLVPPHPTPFHFHPSIFIAMAFNHIVILVTIQMISIELVKCVHESAQGKIVHPCVSWCLFSLNASLLASDHLRAGRWHQGQGTCILYVALLRIGLATFSINNIHM